FYHGVLGAKQMGVGSAEQHHDLQGARPERRHRRRQQDHHRAGESAKAGQLSMMWADRTPIGLPGLTAVVIALFSVIDRFGSSVLFPTNEPVASDRASTAERDVLGGGGAAQPSVSGATGRKTQIEAEVKELLRPISPTGVARPAQPR